MDIYGTPGNDSLVGSDAPDSLYGEDGNDTLVGGAGNDTLSGGEGDDWLDGGEGINQLVGGRGNDTYVINAPGLSSIFETVDGGVDTVRSDSTYALGNFLENLVLSGAAAIDGNGNELDNDVTGNDNANRLKGEAGNDRLFGLAGNDTLEGGAGNDSLFGGDGDDQLLGGEGDDWLDGGAGFDRLEGGTGNDTYVVTGPGGMIIEGPAGGGVDTVRSSGTYALGYDVENLVLTGTAAIDGNGNELDNELTGNASNNRLKGEAGNDRLFGLAGDDTLEGGDGDDWLDGGEGVNQLIGGSGNDTYVIDGYAYANVVVESTGGGVDTVRSNGTYVLGNALENLILSGAAASDGNGNELDNDITGNANDNRLKGEAGDDRLYGLAGKDSLEGGAGNDSLFGGEGDDQLLGGDGNDRLEGGVGNDQLDGGSGNDTYVFARGWGQDVINNYDAGNGVEAIEFAAGIVAGDIQLGHQGDDLILTLKGSTDSLRVTGYFLNNGAGAYALEQIRFSNGQTWSFAQVRSMLLQGTSGDDRLVGFSTADTLDGGAGNDTLEGAEGNDVLIGGAGNDLLTGGAGTDTLRGGLGDDTYVIDSTTDLIQEYANEGTDTLQSSVSITALTANVENLRLTGSGNLNGYGNTASNLLTGNQGANLLYGLAGNDTLSGEGGNDYLEGGVGNDVYRFARGWGVDTVNNYESATNGLDAIEFAADILPGDIQLSRSGSSLVLSLTGSSDKITVSNYFGSDGTLSYAVDEIRFANGVRWTVAEVKAMALLGTAGNDSLTGYASADSINGGAGNDSISGADGNDSLDGGSGNDVLDGGNGDDRLVGGAGDDTLRGGAGNDVFVVDAVGDVVSDTSGIDTVEASASYTLVDGIEHLTLTGTANLDGTGNGLDNTLTGNAGTNRLDGGDGNDVLNGGEGNDTLLGGAGNDLLNGGAGANWLEGGAGDDVYRVDSSTDQVVEAAGGGIDTVESSVTRYELWGNVENLTLTGSAAIDGAGNQLDNLIIGNAANNALAGGAGNDTLYGGDGDDWLHAGAGNDSLYGGRGDDIYIVDTASAAVLENADEGVDTVKASLSYTLTANVENLTLTGTSASNGTGNELANVIKGNDASNVLMGGAGNDTLVGGLGNDQLSGGDGSDVYVFGAGWGRDVIDNLDAGTGKLDVIQFLDGISPADITVLNLGDDLYLRHSGLNDTVTVKNYFGPTSSTSLEEIRFADGTVWTAAQIRARFTSGTAGSEQLVGFSGDDTLLGFAGNDTLRGAAGNDLLDGGTGNDYMAGGAGNDVYRVDSSADTVFELANEGVDSVEASVAFTLGANVENLSLTGAAAINGWGNSLDNLMTGNEANNALYGDLGNNTLYGNGGNDQLVTGSGNDYLDGGAGDDTLTAGDGNDTLLGGAGNDTLNGGRGDDRLYGAEGNDSLYGGAGNDTYVIDSAGDSIVEYLNEGTDTVEASISHTLAFGVENLTLTGADAITGTGNTQDNVLRGNGAANLLSAGAGNDSLAGGAGNDTLVGGGGSDTYTFGLDDGQDLIQNNDAAPESVDVLQFGAGISIEQLWFRQNGANLDVSLVGGTERVSIENWYAGNANHLDQFKAADGRTLLDSQVQGLVDAMAAFGVPAGAETTLSTAQRDELNLVIAANWQ